jgi:hypothetical protein
MQGTVVKRIVRSSKRNSEKRRVSREKRREGGEGRGGVQWRR